MCCERRPVSVQVGMLQNLQAFLQHVDSTLTYRTSTLCSQFQSFSHKVKSIGTDADLQYKNTRFNFPKLVKCVVIAHD